MNAPVADRPMNKGLVSTSWNQVVLTSSPSMGWEPAARWRRIC